MNKIIIIGLVGKNPETRTFENGGKISTFTMATTEHWKTKEGEKKERTEWHTVQVSAPGMVGLVEKYVSKGMKVAVEGLIRYTSSGEGESKKYYTKIQADRIEFLSKPNLESSGHEMETFEADENGPLPF
jgi:single-strand DNA-binding protein